MLIFIIITVLFWLAGCCILKFFFFMIQTGGALDLVFGWQKMLNKLYNGNKAHQLLGKALGDCQMCTSFWFMPIWFFCYWFFCKQVLGYWVTDHVHTIAGCVFVNIIWYYLFHSIGAFFGFIGLTKLMLQKK